MQDSRFSLSWSLRSGVFLPMQKERICALSALGAYSTRLTRMSLPMNCLNSAGEISPKPLQRVISGLPPSFVNETTAL